VSKQALFDVSCEERCEKLEAALRMVWVYSHEISNLITVILGNSELIDDALHEHESARKQVQEIACCARRIGHAAGKVSSLKEHFMPR
jgi:signal transduction histidine kinase